MIGPMTGWWHFEEGEDSWQLYGFDDDDKQVVIADLTFHQDVMYDSSANAHIIEASKAMYDTIKSALAIRYSREHTPEGAEPHTIDWGAFERVITWAGGREL